MSGATRARQVVLAVTAVVFAGIALASIVAPQTMADPLGYTLSNTNALNEFRAIYVGLWLAHAVVLIWAARRIDLIYLGDVAGILILGQVVGRLLSLGLDGIPDERMAPIAFAEFIGAALILGLRGRTAQGHEP